MQMPKGPFCQSCGMPMDAKEKFGTETGGKPSKEYCVYCYKDGKFTNPNISLQGMIDMCAGIMSQKLSMKLEETKAQASGFLPKLKRWQKK